MNRIHARANNTSDRVRSDPAAVELDDQVGLCYSVKWRLADLGRIKPSFAWSIELTMLYLLL
jgi:hypothetical protein